MFKVRVGLLSSSLGWKSVVNRKPGHKGHPGEDTARKPDELCNGMLGLSGRISSQALALILKDLRSFHQTVSQVGNWTESSLMQTINGIKHNLRSTTSMKCIKKNFMCMHFIDIPHQTETFSAYVHEKYWLCKCSSPLGGSMGQWAQEQRGRLTKAHYWEIMFKRVALVFTNLLSILSKPSSMPPMPTSSSANRFCRARLVSLSEPFEHRARSADPTCSNSLMTSSFGMFSSAPLSISLETSNHFVCPVVGPDVDRKSNTDRSTEMLEELTSRSTLITADKCWSQSRICVGIIWLSVCLIVAINLLASFFIFHLKLA